MRRVALRSSARHRLRRLERSRFADRRGLPLTRIRATTTPRKNRTSTPAHPGALGTKDIRWGLEHSRSIEEIADFLCRNPSEIRQRMREIAEADAIGA